MGKILTLKFTKYNISINYFEVIPIMCQDFKKAAEIVDRVGPRLKTAKMVFFVRWAAVGRANGIV